MSATGTTIGELLSDDALDALRAGYDRALMSSLATKKAWEPYPDARELIDAVGTLFYSDKSSLSGRDREMILVAILGSGGFPPFTLAVHLYWALMEGLSVDQLAQVITLTGTYTGLPRMTDGYFTLRSTLARLAVAAKSPDTATSSAVLGDLIAAFR